MFSHMSKNVIVNQLILLFPQYQLKRGRMFDTKILLRLLIISFMEEITVGFLFIHPPTQPLLMWVKVIG